MPGNAEPCVGEGGSGTSPAKLEVSAGASDGWALLVVLKDSDESRGRCQGFPVSG